MKEANSQPKSIKEIGVALNVIRRVIESQEKIPPEERDQGELASLIGAEDALLFVQNQEATALDSLIEIGPERYVDYLRRSSRGSE